MGCEVTFAGGVKCIGEIGHLNRWVGYSDFKNAIIRGIENTEDVSMRNYGYKYIGGVGCHFSGIGSLEISGKSMGNSRSISNKFDSDNEVYSLGG